MNYLHPYKTIIHIMHIISYSFELKHRMIQFYFFMNQIIYIYTTKKQDCIYYI